MRRYVRYLMNRIVWFFTPRTDLQRSVDRLAKSVRDNKDKPISRITQANIDWLRGYLKEFYPGEAKEERMVCAPLDDACEVGEKDCSYCGNDHSWSVSEDEEGPCRVDVPDWAVTACKVCGMTHNGMDGVGRFDTENRGKGRLDSRWPLAREEVISIRHGLSKDELFRYKEVQPDKFGSWPLISAKCWPAYPMCGHCGREHDGGPEWTEEPKSYWTKVFDQIDRI